MFTERARQREGKVFPGEGKSGDSTGQGWEVQSTWLLATGEDGKKTPSSFLLELTNIFLQISKV